MAARHRGSPFVPGRDDRAAFAAVEEAFVDHWEHSPADYGRGGGSGSSARATIPPWGRSWALTSEGTEIVGTVLCRYNGEMGWAN